MRSLMLSGWTQPADALAAVAPGAAVFDYSDYQTVDESFAALEKFRDVESVIAWSLGGQLALKGIEAGVLAPKQLTLIAAPVQFVSGNGMHGMDPVTFAQFRDSYARDAARTASRFHALVAKGDDRMAEVRKQLHDHPQVTDTSRWLPWLDGLAQESLLEMDVSRMPTTLIVHGRNDAIVPFAQSEWLASRLLQARLELWEDTSHAPHLHDPSRLVAAMGNYFQKREAA